MLIPSLISREILEITDNIGEIGGIVWPLFYSNVIVWTVTYLCIIKGVQSVGKVVYFSATFPFVVLGILFVRGITLPGAIEGIKFYIMPKWHELANLKVFLLLLTYSYFAVWRDFLKQLIFFCIGLGRCRCTNILLIGSG